MSGLPAAHPDPLDAVRTAQSGGRVAVLVTVLAVAGEAPSQVGAKLVVDGDGGVLAGTLGCSEFDAAGVALAAEASAEGGESTVRRRVVFGHGRDQELELFAEVHRPGPVVVVLGANAIGRAVADLSGFLGRRVALLDSDAGLAETTVGAADAIVLSDHDAPYVDAALRWALASPAGFVGMLGSRRHAPEVVARLRAAGVPGDQLARLHSPCGLDIGSRGTAEIALSIVGEIVAVGHGRPGGPLHG